MTIIHNIAKAVLSLVILASGLVPVAHAVVVDPVVIRDQVVGHVKSQLASLVSREDQSRIEVSILNIPGGTLEMKGAETIEDVRFEARSNLAQTYSSRAIVRLTVSDGLHARLIGVPVTIEIKKPVWVAKNGIDAKAPLKRSDFTLETRDVSAVYGYALGSERDLNQYIARVNLRPGEWLDARKVEIPPDVARNSEVRIIMSNGQGMTVTVPGIAIDEGRIGQTIKVRQQINTKKTHTAKIIDRHKVLVEM